MDKDIKKFILVLIFSLMFVSSSYAASGKIGTLSKLNVSPEEYKNFVDDERSKGGWRLAAYDNENFVFFDSLDEMLMALNSGRVSEISLPEIIANYVLNQNPKCTISGVEYLRPIYLVFGFMKNNTELQENINNAIASMKEDGTLKELQEKYLNSANIPPVEIKKFNTAESIKVAVTGDLPPIDFVEADGTPVGFNVAIMAEVSKRLGKNFELIDFDSGARSAALSSGKVDLVFWYFSMENPGKQIDIPENIIVSDSYYTLNKFIHIKMK